MKSLRSTVTRIFTTRLVLFNLPFGRFHSEYTDTMLAQLLIFWHKSISSFFFHWRWATFIVCIRLFNYLWIHAIFVISVHSLGKKRICCWQMLKHYRILINWSKQIVINSMSVARPAIRRIAYSKSVDDTM